MSSQVEIKFLELNKRYATAEDPILKDLKDVIGTERLKRFKKYLFDKRQAAVERLPPKDSMSKMVNTLFEDLEDSTSDEERNVMCDRYADNYLKMEKSLFKYMKDFILEADDTSLVNLRDLDEKDLRIGKGDTIKFTEPLEGEITKENYKKDEGFTDYVQRAKMMAKVLNDKIAQPFRSHANQVTLSEKLDTLCQYILIKNDPTEEMEQTRENLKELDWLLTTIADREPISEDRLEEIDEKIGYEKDKPIEVIIKELEEGLSSFIDADTGKPLTLQELLPKGTTPTTPPIVPNKAMSDIKVLTNTQAKAVENLFLTLMDARNSEGMIITEKNKAGINDIPRPVITKVNKAIKQFKAQWERLYQQDMPDLNGLKPDARIGAFNQFNDLFTQAGMAGNPKVLGSRIEQLIEGKDNPFSLEFTEMFNKVKSVEDSSEIPDLFEKGILSTEKIITDFDTLAKSIKQFKCKTEPEAVDIVLKVGEAAQKIQDKGATNKEALNKLSSVIKKYFKFNADLVKIQTKLTKEDKKTKEDFVNLLTEVNKVCLNPALTKTKYEITPVAEDYDIAKSISEELEDAKKLRKLAPKRIDLMNIIEQVWTDNKMKSKLTEYEKLKFLYGSEVTHPDDMVEYLEALITENTAILGVEQITEEAFDTSTVEPKIIKTRRPFAKDVLPSSFRAKGKEAEWIYEDTGESVKHTFPSVKAMSSFGSSIAERIEGVLITRKGLTKVSSPTAKIIKEAKTKEPAKKTIKEVGKKRGRGRPTREEVEERKKAETEAKKK